MPSQKYAIITGASSGIGRAIAIELAKANYLVVLVGRNQDNLKQIQSDVAAVGGSCSAIVANLNTFSGINELIIQIKNTTKHINVFVNAAAIWHGENEVFAGKELSSLAQTVVTDTMMVGLMAPTLLAHALIPLMAPKSKIINISGTFENGGKGWIPYFVSKRGLEDLTISLADELKDKDIQVNAISPSDTATPAYAKFFPEYLEDSVDPIEIAKQTLNLCSPAGDNITGQVFVLKKDQPITAHFHA